MKTKLLSWSTFLSMTITFLAISNIFSPSIHADDEVPWEESEQGLACAKNQESLKELQALVFNLKSGSADDPKKLIDLLRKRDHLSAKMAVNLTLLRIWNEYQGFLGENKNLSKAVIKNPENSQALFSGLNKLQDFMKRNQGPVERYHVVSEVLNSIGPEELARIKQTRADTEKFAIIKQALVNRCKEDDGTLYICKSVNGSGDSLIHLKTASPPNQTPSRDEFVNSFANILSELDGGVDLADFSDAFIDNSNDFNPIGDLNFVTNFNSIINKSKEYCRQKVLISDDNVEDCLTTDFEKVQLTADEELTVKRLVALNPEAGSIRNLSNLVSSYVDVANKTHELHTEEIRNGTVEDLLSLAKEVKDWRGDFSKAEAVLSNSEAIENYRNDFKNLTQKKFLELGNFLNKHNMSNNEKIFKEFSPSENGDSPLMKGAAENNAGFANRLLNEIICDDSTQNCKDIEAFKAFKMEGDKMVVDESAIIKTFTDMMKAVGGGEKLHEVLYTDTDSLSKELSAVESEIRTLKQSADYKKLNALKNFAWKEVEKYCQRKVDNVDVVSTLSTPSCGLSAMVQTGLNDFLKVGNDLLAFNDREEQEAGLLELRGYCDDFFYNQRELYDSKLNKGKLCTEISNQVDIKTQADQDKTEEARYKQNREKRLGVIYEWEDGKRTGEAYVPKKTWGMALVSGAEVVRDNMGLYFGHQLVPAQLDSWKFQAKQQKTNMAWMEAQQQSGWNLSLCMTNFNFQCHMNGTYIQTISPYAGQSAFDFGSTSTVPTTIQSTGFGF